MSCIPQSRWRGRFVSLNSDKRDACPTTYTENYIVHMTVAREVYPELNDRPVPAVNCNFEVVAASLLQQSLARSPSDVQAPLHEAFPGAHVMVSPSDCRSRQLLKRAYRRAE